MRNRSHISTSVGGGVFFGIIAVWLIGVILSLGLTGTLIWAIYKLVMHFTA